MNLMRAKRMKIKKSVLTVLAMTLLFTTFTVAEPVMWGIDEDDAQLFRVGNYTDLANTFTSYGSLKWSDDGGATTNSFAANNTQIESFAIANDGHTAYMVVNKKIGSYSNPTLLSIDLNNVNTEVTNVATVVGQININYDNYKDNITGLSFDRNGNLYTLFGDGKAEDKLYTLNTANAQATLVGSINGNGYSSQEGEDLIIDGNGNLMVTDFKSHKIYSVDPVTAAIIDVVADNKQTGLGIAHPKLEAIAWDEENQRLVVVNNHHNQNNYASENMFYNETLAGGSEKK